MPELPDVELYLSSLRTRIAGHALERVRLATPFLLRSVEPPLDLAEGRVVTGFRRLGKRIVWELEAELFLVFHLMIAGRFKWRERGVAVPRKMGLAAFDFRTRHAAADRSCHAEARVAARRAGRSRAGVVQPRRARSDDERYRGIRSRASEGEPHAQARADRSASVQRHRQRVLR